MNYKTLHSYHTFNMNETERRGSRITTWQRPHATAPSDVQALISHIEMVLFSGLF
jgi:hypothetical protein